MVDATPSLDTLMTIGRIVSAQGLRGEVRVYPKSDFPKRFLEPGQRWLLAPNQSTPTPIELLAGRVIPGKGLYVLKLAGIDSRKQAEQLRGYELLVSATDRLPLGEDEFHVLDLIGLTVFDQSTQIEIGTVTNVFSAGNDLLEVKRTTAVGQANLTDPVLIPFVKAIVPVVDLVQQRIEITPPPGLLD
ncbi:ribosome maturation factor RimM [Trichothermofontia sp.]